MHSAVTYSGIGGWDYKEGAVEKLSVFELVTFAFLQSNIQAWSMGALFFISAYLATKALARRTISGFIKERAIRLGIPLLIYMFIISPFIYFVIFDWGTGSTITEKYLNYLKSFGYWFGSTGPLWFVQTLLLFCIIYALFKKYIPVKNKISAFDAKHIIFAIFITGIIAFSIRIIYPIGSSFYNLQFPYFSSYIALFVLGIIIGENNLFEYISREQNIKWFKVTLIIGPIMWAPILLGGALEGRYYFEGGLYWQNAAYALWESFKAFGFTIGLIAFFRKYLNIRNKFTSLVSENAFGIYVFHAPLLIIISLLLKHWITFPLLKFVAVTIIAFFACLVFTFLVRKIKPVGFIFK
jgi:hypothetical protein